MKKIVSSTHVRKNWSDFIDKVIRNHPQFIKRNRDIVALLSMDHLNLLLDIYKLNISLEREPSGVYQGALKELDIYITGNNVSEVLNSIVDELVLYTEEYMDNFIANINSKNRKSHFPYILKLLVCINNKENIKDLLIISN